jgi:hypothetical protein
MTTSLYTEEQHNSTNRPNCSTSYPRTERDQRNARVRSLGKLGTQYLIVHRSNPSIGLPNLYRSQLRHVRCACYGLARYHDQSLEPCDWLYLPAQLSPTDVYDYLSQWPRSSEVCGPPLYLASGSLVSRLCSSVECMGIVVPT